MGAPCVLQGHTEHALECYIAALCISPFESNFDNCRLWAEISTLLRHEGSSVNQRRILRIQELVQSRQGYFSYLNAVADRDADVARIVDRLKAFGR